MNTPMSKLARHFSVLHLQMHAHCNNLKIHDWNHAKPKDTSYSRFGFSRKNKKGVKSHFLRIYRFKGVEKTFAFAFSYLNEDRPQEVLAITLDKSQGDVYTSSEPILVEDIKPLMDQFITEMGGPEPDFDRADGHQVIAKFEKIFLSGTLLQDCQQVKDMQKTFEEEFEKENKKKVELEQATLSLKGSLDEANKAYSEELKASPEHIEMMELERKIAIARVKVKEVQNKLEDKYSKDEIEKDFEQKSKELDNFDYETERKKYKYLESIPWFLQEEINFEFKYDHY